LMSAPLRLARPYR